jgi:hypothetical protein
MASKKMKKIDLDNDSVLEYFTSMGKRKNNSLVRQTAYGGLNFQTNFGNNVNSIIEYAVEFLNEMDSVLLPRVIYKFPTKKTFNYDYQSRAILGENVCSSNNYIPVQCTANGDCLFNAASILLYGNESFHAELRVRTFIELIVNAEKYSKQLCFYQYIPACYKYICIS